MKGYRYLIIIVRKTRLKSSGYERNKSMAEYANACICFWDGKSKGTRHMIELAKHYKLEIRVNAYNQPGEPKKKLSNRL